MNRSQNRLIKTRQLIEEAGGQARFAEMLGISPSQVWQIAGNAPVRGIGSKMAARIEQAFCKPSGWLDWPADESQANLGFESVDLWPFPSVPLEEIRQLSDNDKRDLEKTIKRFVAGCLAERKKT